MRTITITRLQAALLGCGMAIASCLATAASRPNVPQSCAFELPKVLDSWQLLRKENPDQSELRILQSSDQWQCVYQCQDTEQVVVVTLLAGAAGPLASHQPEVCYARDEYRSHSDAHVWTVPERGDKFRFQTLEPRRIMQPALTIAYAWHDGVLWRAPRVPRLQLAGHATLQRLQITMRHPSGMAHDAEATLQRFLRLTLDATDTPQSRVTSPPATATASL